VEIYVEKGEIVDLKTCIQEGSILYFSVLSKMALIFHFAFLTLTEGCNWIFTRYTVEDSELNVE
jgi:hypothetical protein